MRTEPQAFKGVASINLYRGRKRLGYLRGYGLYVTNERLLGVKINNSYRVLMLAPQVAWVLSLVAVFPALVHLQETLAPPVFAAIVIPLISVLPTMAVILLPQHLVEKRLKSFAQPSQDWLVERKDFEVDRGQIRSIEFRWPGDLRIGHILIETTSGPIKIWLAQPRRRGLILEIKGLLAAFCDLGPGIPLVEKVW